MNDYKSIASELADFAIKHYCNVYGDNPVIHDDEEETESYTPEAQEDFNDMYEGFLSILTNRMQEKNNGY